MSNWDKWLKNDGSRMGKKHRRDFDDYDGEMIEKSKSKRKSHRSKHSTRQEDFEDRLY
ncbi:MAG: hypothetical protein ACK5NC_04880 [Vibrio sp.]